MQQPQVIRHPRDLTAIQLEKIFNEDPYTGVALVDIENNEFLWANPKYADILGRSLDEVIGLDWTTITDRTDESHDLAMVRRVLDPKDPLTHYAMKKRYLDKWGLPIPVEIDVHGVADDEGHVLVFFVRCIDIDPTRVEPMRSLALEMRELRDNLAKTNDAQVTDLEMRLGKAVAKHWPKILGGLLTLIGAFAASLYTFAQQ